MPEEQQNEKIFNIEEVMERLSLKRAEVYRQTKDKHLKATKVDHQLQFTETDIAAYETKFTDERNRFLEALDYWLEVYATRLEKHGETELPDLSEKTDAERVAELGRRIVLDGVLSKVNDIYLDPLYSGDRLLYRFEGNLKEVGHLEGQLSKLLKTKLKALAALTAAENQVSEAIFRHTHKERFYQIRQTVVPTLLGEHLHLFFYDSEAKPTTEVLGYTPKQVAALRNLLTGRPGLFLMVGAADSTSSRHRLALADELSAAGRLVVALEHHIQYRSESLVQLEIGHEEPQSFDILWRTALGMSPDVLFIDDVRDATEAQALLEGVYAGSVVVAQIRAAGGFEALAQLFEFEMNRDSVARLLLGLVERTALRRLCPHCRVERSLKPEEADLLETPTDTTIWKESGCEICGDGFLGRRMLYGLWPMVEELATYIRSLEAPLAPLEAWRNHHPLSLRHAAQAAVLAGEVTFEDAGTLLGTAISEPQAEGQLGHDG